MARTVQKRVKFSKGQIAEELIERTDTDILDSSAQLMKNVVSTVYGGIRSRRGTKYIDIITALDEAPISEITSDVYPDTSHFTDNTYAVSQSIGTNRLVGTLDFGSNRDGTAKFQIKNINVRPVAYEYTEATEITQALAEGRYKITAVGGGSGGSYNLDLAGGEEHPEKQGCASGASGAYLEIVVDLKAGNYNLKVGSGGAKSGGFHDEGTFTSEAGGNTTISLNGTDIIVCGGGSSATSVYAKYFQGYAGTGGKNTYPSDCVSIVENVGGNNGSASSGYTTMSGGASVYNGYGSGGSATAGNGSGSAEDGTDGYLKIELVDSPSAGTTHNLVISTSTDGSTYTERSTEVISQTVRDIELTIPKDRYVKMYLDDDTSEEIEETLAFQYLRENVSLASLAYTKLVPFVYNNSDKYLLVLAEGQIQIFYDDKLIQNIEATGLKEEYLKDLKYATKDDTIIFTHKNMYPKILKRTDESTFTWGDLDLTNIPYDVFGSETTTKKTTGIKPSEKEGAVKITADSSIFDETWVGQYIDGNGGRVKITEYTSGTVVNGYTIIPFYTDDKISSWDYISGYEKVWSETRGYPVSCLFAQQRLWFGGSKDKPDTIWASRLGDYFNFKNSGNNDNDSIDVDILTNDPILSMTEQRGIHVFTSGQEYTATEGTYTPDKFSIVKNTANGSIGLQPVVISGAVVFVEKNGKSLLSYVYDDNQSSFVSDNLSLFSNLIQAPISMDAEINSSKDKGDFLYLVLSDGTMLVACIVLSQQVMSISKFVTDGTIIGVCCLREDVYISVIRNGDICIEKITEGTKTDCVETRYISDSKVKGLYRFNDKYVYVYSDKENYGRYKVSDNSVTLEKVPYENCNIGIAFDYELISNPISVNHMTTSIKKRITKAELVCHDTYQLSFCGQEKHSQDQYKFYACTPYGNSVKYNISGEFYPIDILSIQLNINYEG